MTNTQYKFLPKKVAFADPKQTSQDWFNQVRYYQAQLQQDPAQTWLLYHEDSYQFSILLFALLLADKDIALPANAQPGQIEQVKTFCQASIGSLEIQPKISPVATTSDSFQAFLQANERELSVAEPSCLLSRKRRFYFYTSGSSGQAKCVEKTFAQLLTEVAALETEFAARFNQATFVSTVSHQHIYGMLFKLLWPILKGHQLICQAFEYPEHINQAVENFNLEQVVLIASPAHLHRIYADNVLVKIADPLALVFSSGGPLEGDKSWALQQQLSTPIIEVFGSTETGGIAWRINNAQSDALWTAFKGIQIEESADNQVLQIVSPYLASAEVYTTDDRIKKVKHNQFKLLGRADRIVKVEEKRVSLDEVQQKLVQHPAVVDAYVLVVGQKRKQLACVLVLEDEAISEFSELKKFQQDRVFRQYLSRWFEAVALPRKFRYLDALPYNAQGKLIKKELESLFV